MSLLLMLVRLAFACCTIWFWSTFSHVTRMPPVLFKKDVDLRMHKAFMCLHQELLCEECRQFAENSIAHEIADLEFFMSHFVGIYAALIRQTHAFCWKTKIE